MPDKTVYIIAGPNGSGKTTFAREFIKDNKLPFLNADEIAFELSPSQIEKVRGKAGRIFLKKIEKYISEGKPFAVETTLSGRYFIRLINSLRKSNYRIEIVYIFVESVEEALRRIDMRVRHGGHSVPKQDVIRRFPRSKNNFWMIYRKMVDNWRIFLNSKDEFLQTAAGEGEGIEVVDDINFSLFKKGIL